MKPTRRHAIALITATACGPRAVPRTSPAPAPRDVLVALRARQTALHAAILSTRTTSWLDDKRLAADVSMIVERSGRLRFDAEVSLKGQVAALTTDGQRFTLLDHQAHVLRSGPACAQNIASLIRIPLLAHEVAAVLLGDAPVAVDARAGAVTWDGEAGTDVLAVENPAHAGEATARLWVSVRLRAGGAVDVVAVEGESTNGEGHWRVRYEDLARNEAGLSRPRLIRFAEPGHGFDAGVEIKIREFEANPAIEPDAFTLQSEDARPEEVGCGP